MAAIDFPNSPTIGDIFTVGDISYEWTGTVWRSVTAQQVLPHAHATTDIVGLSATAAELNVLDGITATTTELNYTDGVTSAIQAQLDGKVNETNGAVTTASTSLTVVRNITLSTGDPTGGADGDVWLKYTV